jgi:hypothetical protein
MVQLAPIQHTHPLIATIDGSIITPSCVSCSALFGSPPFAYHGSTPDVIAMLPTCVVLPLPRVTASTAAHLALRCCLHGSVRHPTMHRRTGTSPSLPHPIAPCSPPFIASTPLCCLPTAAAVDYSTHTWPCDPRCGGTSVTRLSAQLRVVRSLEARALPPLGTGSSQVLTVLNRHPLLAHVISNWTDVVMPYERFHTWCLFFGIMCIPVRGQASITTISFSL